jgi:hypothetical protein
MPRWRTERCDEGEPMTRDPDPRPPRLRPQGDHLRDRRRRRRGASPSW